MDDLASWSQDVLRNLFGAIDQRFAMHDQVAKYNTDVKSYNAEQKKKKELEVLKNEQFWDLSGKSSPFDTKTSKIESGIEAREGDPWMLNDMHSQYKNYKPGSIARLGAWNE